VEKLIYPNKKLVKIDFYNFSFERSPLEGGFRGMQMGKKTKKQCSKTPFYGF